MKTYATTSRGFYGSRQSQKYKVYARVQAAGAAGVDRASLVAASVALGIPAKNVAFYINKLAKDGHIVETSGAAYNPPPPRPTPPPPQRPSGGVSQSPFAKPASAQDAVLAALVAFEAAMVACVKQNPALVTDAVDKSFSRYQLAKTRVLASGSYGSANEDANALSLAMKGIIDIVILKVQS